MTKERKTGERIHAALNGVVWTLTALGLAGVLATCAARSVDGPTTVAASIAVLLGSLLVGGWLAKLIARTATRARAVRAER